MKILLYCHAFYPSIGGIETVTETLAKCLTNRGHTIILVTEILEHNEIIVETGTLTKDKVKFPFEVVRRPVASKILRLMYKVDVVCTIDINVKYILLSKIARKPLICTHNGYKLISIDGLGWNFGGPTPLNPWQSVLFYKKKKGLYYAIKEGFKLYFRRLAVASIYSNVAASVWISKRQELSKQVQIYPLFPLDKFTPIAHTLNKKYDFLFLGRLVEEKGLETLLRAFQDLMEKTRNYGLKLAIVGYGIYESELKNIALELAISDNVDFLGPKKGEDLNNIISQCEVAVVPSYWEEPLGGVALELMAAGRILIVSKNGGLPEIIGESGLTFINGDWKDLSQKMMEIISNDNFKNKLRDKRKSQLDKFDSDKLTNQYIDLFNKAISN